MISSRPADTTPITRKAGRLICNEYIEEITNAERVFGYITCDNDFEEEHIGLYDVRIEAQILARCFAQHKHMETNPYHANWRLPGKAYEEMVA